jgi:hypothetical protein
VAALFSPSAAKPGKFPHKHRLAAEKMAGGAPIAKPPVPSRKTDLKVGNQK